MAADNVPDRSRRRVLVGGIASAVALGAAASVKAASSGNPKASPKDRVSTVSRGMDASGDGGHLYMQTNEKRNFLVHYRRSGTGRLKEVERAATGGAGSGVFKPISGQESAPNSFEGAGSVIVTADRRFLFTTNGGDNSVSSFDLQEDGRLTLLDVKPTGNVVHGKSGTAKSLTHNPSSNTLLVVHSFGPDHVRLMSVDGKGKLTSRPEAYTVNTRDKTDRVATMGVLSPNGKFFLVGTTFDQSPIRTGAYPDGSPIIWVRGPDGTFKVIASNAPDPDGLVIFAVEGKGTLGRPSFQDAGGASPFYIAFLHERPNTFVIGYAVSNGVAIANINEDGMIRAGRLVQIDTSAGRPSELCWLAVSPDNQFIFTTNFGYSNISSFRLDGDKLSIAKDPACPKVSGDGTFRAINGTVSSGPSDSWMTPDGAHLYQIYGNASKLVGYATQTDGSLMEVTSVEIPYNSPQGLAGF
jgi:6-phosphogluconolactonase (cycloisomerase 2 family)